MTDHRTDWHRLSIRTAPMAYAEATGWWNAEDAVWMLDRRLDGGALAYAHTVTDLGPADVLVLPAPSGPVVKKSWGWECGNVEADDLADADAWAAELPQHIADSRAIAAHIRGLGEVTEVREVPEPPVWLDPQPLVPRPEPVTPTLAQDVATVRAWEVDEGANYPNEAMVRILDVIDIWVTK